MESNDDALSQAELTAQADQAEDAQTGLAPEEVSPVSAAPDQASLPEEDIPPAGAEAVQEGPDDQELFLAALDGEMPMGEELDSLVFAPPKRGQIVRGTIASKSDSEILVDVGAKSEGVVTGAELEQLDPEYRNSLQVGDEVYVYVLTPEDRNGHIQLSLRRAMEEQDWREAQEYLEQARSYRSKIAGYNKGGLIVRFGKLRGFVPASHISLERRRRANGATPEERWGQMIGEEIMVKVVEVDRGRNRLILSERAAAKELRAERRAQLMESLDVGQIYKGRVISLADFGAFVDIGGVDGLVHLSELSWEHVAHPKEVLKIGDEVEVEVINVDRERQRVGLSRKKCLQDPWEVLAATYRPGQLVQGTITKMTKFGAFASLVDRPEIEGLIHISELSERRVKHPREVVEEGQVLTLRVIRIDSERRRLGLSLRRVDSEEYLDEDWYDVIEPPQASVSLEVPDDYEEAEAPTAPEKPDADEEAGKDTPESEA
jgi:small subunit ribosomal protein S1